MRRQYFDRLPFAAKPHRHDFQGAQEHAHCHRVHVHLRQRYLARAHAPPPPRSFQTADLRDSLSLQAGKHPNGMAGILRYCRQNRIVPRPYDPGNLGAQNHRPAFRHLCQW